MFHGWAKTPASMPAAEKIVDKMKKYLFKINGQEIGETDLEGGDPPMGMVLGVFFWSSKVSPKYFSKIIKTLGNEANTKKENGIVYFSLPVNPCTVEGNNHKLSFDHINLEYCPELNESMIYLRISSEEYENFFPDHVAKYKNQFQSK